ncbi:MAG: hypothetical protein ABSB77_02480 [Xanthobacteraceae bacterium]|jgi:hypothetical protein
MSELNPEVEAAKGADQQPAGGDAKKVVPLRDPPAPKAVATTCASFKIGDLDGSGRTIAEIYFKRERYVIYCTTNDADMDADREVRVQYADDPATADKQIADVADVIPLRNKLQFLLPEIANKNRYYAQIAEAFRLGLEHQIDVAKETLEGAIQEVQIIRGSDGRNIYINQAWPYAASAAIALIIASAAFLYFGGVTFTKAWSTLGHLLLAAAAGALGALLSIAISVRTRSVATDGDNKSIRIDAWLRILIGVICAAVLYLILGTGVLSQVQVGNMKFNAGLISWQLSLLAGFAAGFLERLVPDLLEKTAKK